MFIKAVLNLKFLMMITYQSPHLELEADYLQDPLGRIHLNDLPVATARHSARLVESSPILEHLWTCALADAESNLIHRDGKDYFCAGGRGKGWNGIVFTRDLAYASLLGLGKYFPQEMRSSMELTRELRLSLGLKTPQDHDIIDYPMKVEPISHDAFMDKYGTNPFCRRTDDVLWLWWAEDLFAQHYDHIADWTWVYETGCRCFDELYTHFFDESDGLYWGQASFIDIGINGYPPDIEYGTIEAYRRSLRIKASSTNALYYQGFTVMARCAQRIGRLAEADMWQSRATTLRKTFRERFIRSDGGVTYFLHEDGRPEPRREALGTALTVSLGLLSEDEAADAFTNYPEEWWGVPLFDPFYDTEATYHNNSAWPFVNAFYLRAKAKATGQDTLPYELALLVRSCRRDTFHEWTHALTREPSGKSAQLWTLAAFLGAAEKMGKVIS